MKLLPHLNPSLKAIYAAALLRSAGVGLTGVLLGVYLSRSGFSGAQMGLVITAGLAALALGTLVVSLCADQLGRRRTLVTISLLGAIGGFGFGLANQFWAIMVLAFLGLVNGMGTDRGPAFALEQAVIPQTVPHELRTQALSWHSLLMDIGHALGALLAGVPLLLSVRFGLALSLSYKLTFCIYAVVNLLSVMVYSLPSVLIEAEPQKNTKNEITRLSPQSRVVVAKLAALSGLDSFGG